MLIHQRNVLQTLLVLYFLLSYDGVQGEMKLSKLEELALEKQLNLLNKPSVKTIKMKPTLSRMKQIPSNSTFDVSSKAWLENEGCPSGTVPIKRVTKNDLIRQRRMPPPEDLTFKSQLEDTNNILDAAAVGYTRAIVKTPDDPNNKFAGAGMIASLWNPHVGGTQHSASRMKIQKGSDSIQVGWRVDPTLYGDTKTRFFVHFQAGNTQCFNTLCSGFVLVNNDIPLDGVFDSISHRGGRIIWELIVYIDRDLANGNWWLLYGKNQVQVGFWPPRIFTALGNDFATNVEWGGVIYNSAGGSYPQMGAGVFPLPEPALDAYCRGLVILNDKGETINAKKTLSVVDRQKYYRVDDRPYWAGGKFPHYMFFGGPYDPRG
ncbi:hypothetical protein RND71_016713 [Anisodus tanguticus]|uniref:Neprosin PEP catalytic domain-containing protein n=1 Tax=Anisodus tanguticus TaxID=243964 RepID=A0AAE1S8D1_9SOLA|nr:hypothetical protein RND71_016713 [Anisodus tanguticus]